MLLPLLALPTGPTLEHRWFYVQTNLLPTWLSDEKPIKGVTGVMYTTWANDYSKLEAFAQAAWGH